MQPTSRQLTKLAELFSVLSDPARLHILQCLRHGARCVSDIHRHCKLKQANASKHLRVLREAGIVTTERHGTSIHYEIANPLILDLCDMVCRKNI